MDKLNIEINTCVSIRNGATLNELGSILQNFTNKYLFIKNDELYSINDISELKSEYSLVKYDDGFMLLNKHTNELIYCFRRDLVTHLIKNREDISPINSPLLYNPLLYSPSLFNRGLPEVSSAFSPITPKVNLPKKKVPKKKVPIKINKKRTRKSQGTKNRKQKVIKKDISLSNDSIEDKNEPQIEPQRHLHNTINDGDALERLGVKPPVNLPIVNPVKITDVDEIEMAMVFDKQSKIKAQEMPITHEVKIPIKEPDEVSFDDNDVMVQSRKNGTSALVEAIRQKRRNAKTHKSPLIRLPPIVYPIIQETNNDEIENTIDLPNPVKVENIETESTDKNNVCSMIAKILKEKAKTSRSDNDNSDDNSDDNSNDNSDKDEDDNSNDNSNDNSDKDEQDKDEQNVNEQDKDEQNVNEQDKDEQNVNEQNVNEQNVNEQNVNEQDKDSDIPAPIVPRTYSKNVHLKNLPVELQDAVIREVLRMKEKVSPFGNFIYDGASINIIVDEDNCVSVFEYENRLNVPRLKPSCFKGEYDKTPCSLPIAQFTVHQMEYFLELCTTKPEIDIGIPIGLIDQEILFVLKDLYKFDESDVSKKIKTLFDDHYCLSFASSELKTVNNDKIVAYVTFLKSINNKEQPERFSNYILSDSHVLLYYRSDLVDNDDSTGSEITNNKSESIDNKSEDEDEC